ncbi:MAG: tyrosine recombinase [Bacilli bacterium]|nr:tyrosine recombinase [Bacilli bacterium]
MEKIESYRDYFVDRQHLKNFLEYLKIQKNYSKDTIISYEEDLTEFLGFCSYHHISYLKVNYKEAKKYLLYLYEEQKEKATTISRKISSIRSFYRYLSSRRITDNSAFSLLVLPKKEKKLPKFFEYSELKEMFAIPDLSNPLGQRNILILEMLYATGVRVSELVGIKIEDISFSEKTIRILGKGNKMRIVYFNEITLKRLQYYIENGRKSMDHKNLSYLFLNQRGGQLTTRRVEQILEEIIKKTSITKHISPHMIRHSFATHLLNEGCDLLSVQQLLGHESLRATSVYTHITNDRIKDVYLKTHPRAKKDK